MKLGVSILTTIVILTGVFLSFQPIQAAGLDLDFFYSKTCPHCIAEKAFLKDLSAEYPQLVINYYPIDEATSIKLLQERLKEQQAEKYLGLVPITFVGKEMFLGFDSSDHIGQSIKEAVATKLGEPKKINQNSDDQSVYLPFVGQFNTNKYSLPTLAVILGVLDGFNVCSLGALILILGLVLTLRSRRKTLIFGGIFLITTAVVYAALIFLWHQIFTLFLPYQKLMTFAIAAISLAGAVYFLKEFIKFRQQGATCEVKESNLVSKLSTRMQDILKNPSSFLAIAGAIFLFAATITIVEFPCSAAVPVVFAGIMAKAQLSPLLYFFYLLIYIFFYLLDEIIVFVIAFLTMKVWLSSPKFVTWITLVEAIILFLLGLFYLNCLF